MIRSLLLVVAVVATLRASAQTTTTAKVTQFTIIGTIQKFIVDTPSDVLSSGKLQVNGLTIVVPRNLVVVFPAAYWTMSQALKMGPAAGSSGLALEDVVRSPGSYTATIVGNILTNTKGVYSYIAGEVNIGPNPLQTTDGFVRAINYTSGELCIGADSTPSANGACVSPDTRIRLIDPSGQYGKIQTRDDLRFAVDADNPTIKAVTGYPMCVPRVAPPSVDPLCPIGNRPKDFLGKTATTFVMSGPNLASQVFGGNGGGITPFVQSCYNFPSFNAATTTPLTCNPDQQAPLSVGDFVTYAGVPTTDGAFGVFSITANVGIYTEQGAGKTAYLTVEEMLLGTGPITCINTPNNECQFIMRVVGFTTDPSRVGSITNRLNFYYVDVDPLTGAKFPRLVIDPFVLNIASAPLIRDAPFFGRFRVDITKRVFNAQVPPADGRGLTRELLLSIDDADPLDPLQQIPNRVNAPSRLKANGLVAGQYWAPVQSFLYPEVATPGVDVPPANFNCLGHLIKGWSLDLYGNGTQVRLPQLLPWPGTELNRASGVNCDAFI